MQFATSAKPLPVLVVDDDSALIRTLAGHSADARYDPSTAGTGREGLALAEHRSPALAVRRSAAAGHGRMELASKLHELSELTEVVVLTGNASVESAVAALREHSVDYLLKPVNVEQLLQVASLATERWQRRHAEVKLRESDERFRRVVESDMLGIMFWDEHGKIDDANAAFLRMTGYSRHDVEQAELDWTAMTPPEFAALDDTKRLEISEKGVIAPYEKELFRKDGSVVPVLVGAATLEGRGDRGVTFILDITDRKRAERSLEAARSSRRRWRTSVAAALTAETLGNLFDDAVAVVAETLDTPLSGVFERRSDGKALVLRAGVGWRGALVGHTMVSSSDATQWGYTLSHNEPAIVTSLAAEKRFSDATLLAASEVASGSPSSFRVR